MTLPRLTKIILLTVVSLLLISGCAIIKTESPLKIALLAPFEGRYREIGYNALYPARLAVRNVDLLAVDDGGSVESAVERARALLNDPLVRAVVVLGYDAADPAVQMAFKDMPVIIVGHWLTAPQSNSVFLLTSAAITPHLSYTERFDVTGPLETPFIGGDVLALEGFRRLHSNYEGITILSSGTLPDAAFKAQISDQFAPEPGLLATTTYDAFGLLLTAMQTSDGSRTGIRQALQSITYDGINGKISFMNNYWREAPLYAYHISPDGELIRTENIVE